jgi:membrane protease YdiL (CAAX protease family)
MTPPGWLSSEADARPDPAPQPTPPPIPRWARSRTLTAGRSLVILAVYVLAQIAVGMGVAICGVLVLIVLRRSAGPAVLAEAQTAIVMPAAVFGLLVAGMLVIWLTVRSTPTPPHESALAEVGWRRASSLQLAMGAGGGLYLVGLGRVFPPSPDQQLGPMTTLVTQGGWPLHLWALVALLVAPPVEELLFRGVLFVGLSRSLGVSRAGAVVTVLFVLAHVTEVVYYWPAAVSVTIVAIVNLVLRARTGSLWPAIALHAFYNLAIVLAAYGSFA